MPFDLKEFQHNKQRQVLIKLMKDDPISIGLSKASQQTGVPETRYIKTALAEKLQRDGYISEDEQIIIHGVGRRATPNK